MRESYIRKIVKIVEESSIESLEYSFSPFGLNVYGLKIQNRAKPKKTIERVVQVADKKSEPSTTVEKKFRLFHHDCDYIKANYAGTFYWCEDKSAPISRLRWRQEIKEGDVLGYLDHFDGLYGNIMTEVTSSLNGYILRKKVKQGRKVKTGGKLFMVYVKDRKIETPKKPKKSKKTKQKIVKS